jgi:hypothetical protein
MSSLRNRLEKASVANTGVLRDNLVGGREVTPREVVAVPSAVVLEMVPEPSPPTPAISEPDNQTTVQSDDQTTARPSPPKRRKHWRDLAIGTENPSPRNRVSITITEETANLLYQRDATLAAEKSRWTVSRNALLAEAIDVIAANPNKWVEKTPTHPTVVNLQGRVDDERAVTLRTIRYAPDGRRNTSAMLAAAIHYLLT